MSKPTAFSFARRSLDVLVRVSSRRINAPVRSFASTSIDGPGLPGGLPESYKKVAETVVYPNEYPGQDYAFNWSLNGDGVTPLKKSAFRITKPLDLKIAGLQQPAMIPLKVSAADESAMPEAGSDSLPFETFDEVSQRTKDLLSSADHLYCPEGHVPGTRTGVRVICNSPTLAPDFVAYLERMPKIDVPESQAITAYVLEVGTDEQFAGYAIEEVEVQIEEDLYEPKSVAAVVVVGKKPDIRVIAKGLELSHKGLMEDEAEREAKKKAEEAEKRDA